MEGLQVRAAALLLFGSLLAGCGGGPAKALEGSLVELYELEYQDVEITRSDNGLELSVAFFQPRGVGRDLVLKVTSRSPASGVSAPIDLAEVKEGQQVGVLSLDREGDPRKELPGLARGTLSLEDTLSPGATIGGELRVTFENGTHPAAGRTVFGSFEGKVP